MNDLPSNQCSDAPARFKVTLLNAPAIVGAALAVLKINGTTFRQAFIRRFGLDPAILDNADTQLALDGFGAISHSVIVMMAALLPLIILSAIVLSARSCPAGWCN